jgi:hypothetical protein
LQDRGGLERLAHLRGVDADPFGTLPLGGTAAEREQREQHGPRGQEMHQRVLDQSPHLPPVLRRAG